MIFCVLGAVVIFSGVTDLKITYVYMKVEEVPILTFACVFISIHFPARFVSVID